MIFSLLTRSLCAIAGVFTPLQWQVLALCGLALGYASCRGLSWTRYQRWLADAIGGLCLGGGIQIAVGMFVMQSTALALFLPLLFWLLARILFQALQRRFELTPGAAAAAGGWIAIATPVPGKAPAVDAAAPADKDGALTWEFFNGGEIAMGGPVFGELVFSNRCAFSGVSPDVVLADDGSHAVLSLPSRDRWGLLMVDFAQRRAYDIAGSSYWNVERIVNGRIIGRRDGTSTGAVVSTGIEAAKRDGHALKMVEDDGWWLLEDAGRPPLPRHAAIEVPSASRRHRVRFEPDVSSHGRNPFERLHTPDYRVLLDDRDLAMNTRQPQAVWVESSGFSDPQRFVWVDRHVYDLASGRVFTLHPPDELTYVTLDAPLATVGGLSMLATAMPRSTSFSDAEYETSGFTFPWDEDEARTYGVDGEAAIQKRERVQRHYRYEVDLLRLTTIEELHLCTQIELINRAQPQHRARWYHEARAPSTGYSRYRVELSCGVDPGPVTHEACWSHCGRYLALLLHADAPAVPDRIRIIDFETATQRDLPGRHALASFIWFDATMLEFTRIVGLRESLTFGPGRFEQEVTRLEDDPALAAASFDLLVGGIAARRARLEAQAKAREAAGGWAIASVNHLAQHAILFAPNFDTPVLQPPPAPRPQAATH